MRCCSADDKVSSSDELNDGPDPDEVRALRERCIDKRRAWIVAFITFLLISMHYGLLNCGCIFLAFMQEDFGQPISVVTWSVTGQMAVTFSLGFGLGASFVRLFAVLAQYFDKYRILALAIGTSGAGFGTIVYMKFGIFLVETYTWRIAVIGVALCHLHVLPLSLLIRPLPMEPVAEPTVILPIKSEVNLGGLKRPTKLFDPDLGASQFASSFSVASKQSVTGGRRSNTLFALPKIVPSEDLQVVIEFVRVKSDTLNPGQFKIEPIQFMNDPGPYVNMLLEEMARTFIGDGDDVSGPHTVVIPLIFFTCDLPGELGGQGQSVGATPFTASQWADLDQSRVEMNDDQAATTTHSRPSFMLGDALGSLVVARQDLQQSYQGVRNAVRQAEQKVSQILIKFKPETGVALCQTPIRVLVDKTDFFAKHNLSTNASGDKLLHVGSTYRGLGDQPIPEEDESGELQLPFVQSTTTVRRELEPITEHGATQIEIERQRARQSVATNLHASAAGLLTQSSFSFITPSRGDPSRWQSGYNLFTSSATLAPRKTSTAFYRSHDFTSRTSVLCADTAQEAIGLLMSKLEMETKDQLAEPLLDDEDGGRKRSARRPRRLVIANPIFIAFLLSRVCTYIADSCIYSHLLNFGLSLGYTGSQTTTILSVVGFATMLSRILIGIIGHFVKRLEIRSTVALTTAVVGLNLLALPHTRQFILTCLSAFVYGFVIGPNFAFSTAIALQLVGSDQAEQAISFVLQFEAIGYLLGGPMSGLLNDAIGSYTPGFTLGAVAELTGAAIMTMLALRLLRQQTSIKKSRCGGLNPLRCCGGRQRSLDIDYALDDDFGEYDDDDEDLDQDPVQIVVDQFDHSPTGDQLGRGGGISHNHVKAAKNTRL